MYNNIDSRINTIFDFYFNENKKTNFIFKPINQSLIEIEDLKVINDNFDISDFFKTKFKFLYKYDNKFFFKRYSSKSFPSTLVIRKGTDGESSGIYNNRMYKYLFSNLFNNQMFDHIIIPLVNFNLTGKELKKYPEISKEIKLNDDDELSLDVVEHYYKKKTLRELFDENKDVNLVEDVIRQVLISLAVIQESYPKFRHNKLNLDNISVYVGNNIKKKYKIKDLNIKIKSNIHVKIGNFDYSTNGKEYRNVNFLEPKDNIYYDVHYFLTCIQRYFGKNIDKKIEKFINSVIPEKFTYKSGSFLDEDIYFKEVNDILSAYNIIKKNNFFTNSIISKDGF